MFPTTKWAITWNLITNVKKKKEISLENLLSRQTQLHYTSQHWCCFFCKTNLTWLLLASASGNHKQSLNCILKSVEKEMATHSSIHSCLENPMGGAYMDCRLQSMGLQRVRHTEGLHFTSDLYEISTNQFLIFKRHILYPLTVSLPFLYISYFITFRIWV